MKRALLALILALPLALSAQFRIVGTGLFTTLNDSTYRAKIDFRPDLTGNSYNATQLNDSMLVLSQKGQLYRLDSFYNASFSSAFIIVVEKNGNWGSPVGQVMVFQNNSSLAAPQAVYGANGATAGMQAGVDTWNALLLKVVSDSAVYWNQAYSNSIDSLNVSGDSLKTITLYRAGGDSISATFVDGGGSGPVTDTLHGEVKGPLDSTYIDTVANIIFTTTTDTTVGVGELKYNDTQGSLIQGLKGGNVTNVIGQQIHQRVTNTTGAPLTKGTAVFLYGSQGNRITVRKALATADSTSANTFGIVAESIADNQSGYVITEGLITNINTNALTEGAAVYLSPTVAGELTTTKPQAPQHTVYIGVCVKQHTGSGELFVKIRNGQELDELHDVRIDSPVSNASLYYNTSESVWRDTTPAALKSDISGTANRLAMFTGSNTVGNSVVDVTSDTVSIRDYSNSYTTWRFHSNINKRGFIGYPSGTRFYSLVNPSLYAGFMYGDRSAGAQDQQAFTQLTAWNGGGAASGFFSAATTLNGADSTLYFNISGLSANANPTFPAAQMVIQKGGNVGINTTTPTAKLHINNPSSTTPALNIVSNSNVIGSTNDAVSINMQPGQVNQNNTGVRVFNTITGTSAEGNNTGIAVSLNARNSSYGVYSAVSKNWGGSSLFGEAIGVYGSATTDSPAGFSYGGYFKNDTTQGTGFGAFIQTTTPKGSGTVTPLAVQHNSTELMRVQSSGNVGINTTTPAYRLDVNGDVNTTGMYKKNGTDIISGTTNYIPKFTGANTIGNSVIQDNGTNVGISASPSSFKLDINGSTHTTGDFYADRAARSASAGFVSAQTNNRWLAGMISNSGSWHVYDLLRSTSVMTLDSATGNVGIGTASPGYKLSVAKYTSGTTQGEIVQSIIGNTVYSTVGQWAGLSLGTYADKVGIFAYDGYNNFGRNDLVFAVASGGNTNPVTLTDEKMRILNNGNVGIATSSPSYPLHVNGTSYANTVITNGNFVGNGQLTTADARSGLVSIGPSSNTVPQYFMGGYGTFYGAGHTTKPGDIEFGVGQNTAGKIVFYTDNFAQNQTMTLTNNSFVGINTASPSRPLHVAGTTAIRIPVGTTAQRPSDGANGDLRYSTTFNNIEFYDGSRGLWERPLVGTVATNKVAFASGDTLTSNTNFHWDNATTKLGIGNAAPDSTLTVTGGIRATTGVRATRFSVNTFSTQVLSINNYAPAGSLGGNTWIGNGGQLSTYSSGNHGCCNVSLGVDALERNTTGNENVAIGISALRFNTTGVRNTAIGLVALSSNISGDGNMALGALSLVSNTSGVYNVGLGISTLRSNITGNYNMAIGTDAMFNNTSGVGNVGIGTSSLYDITTSNYNVGIGGDAGRYTNAGNSNQTSSNSIYIGRDTRASASGNTNEIVIGDQGRGNGSNTTTIGNSSTTNTVIPAGSLTVDVMRRKAPVTVTGNHTVAASTSWLICDGTATIFLTLPTASSWTGREIMVKTIQPQAVNSAANDVVPIDGVAAGAGILPATDGAWCTLVSDGTNWIIMQRGN